MILKEKSQKRQLVRAKKSQQLVVVVGRHLHSSCCGHFCWQTAERPDRGEAGAVCFTRRNNDHQQVFLASFICSWCDSKDSKQSKDSYWPASSPLSPCHHSVRPVLLFRSLQFKLVAEMAAANKSMKNLRRACISQQNTWKPLDAVFLVLEMELCQIVGSRIDTTDGISLKTLSQ